MTRTLVVMRHAHAEPHGETDYSRSLSDRGIAQAAVTDVWLLQNDVHVDVAIVSSALRTVMTCANMSHVTESILVDDLYNADAVEISRIICATAIEHSLDDVSTLLVIAHNPGVSDFVSHAAMPINLKPAECVVFDFSGDWIGFDSRLLKLRLKN